jgi:hypothetical protein
MKTFLYFRRGLIGALIAFAFSASSYANTSDAITLDLLSMEHSHLSYLIIDLAIDTELEPTVDFTASNVLSLPYRYSLSRFLEGSPEKRGFTSADTAAFKLNLVPWQFNQA